MSKEIIHITRKDQPWDPQDKLAPAAGIPAEAGIPEAGIPAEEEGIPAAVGTLAAGIPAAVAAGNPAGDILVAGEGILGDRLG